MKFHRPGCAGMPAQGLHDLAGGKYRDFHGMISVSRSHQLTSTRTHTSGQGEWARWKGGTVEAAREGIKSNLYMGNKNGDVDHDILSLVGLNRLHPLTGVLLKQECILYVSPTMPRSNKLPVTMMSLPKTTCNAKSGLSWKPTHQS